jgi:phosphatidylinositol alpha-1,6-mannosyltransferase
VARLLAKVLIEDQEAALIRVRGLTLSDRQLPADLDLPVALSRGSKVRFSLWALQAALRYRHFIYDGCHLAQVHSIPPLSCKPFLTYLHGVEVWENAKAGYVKSARRATMLIANSQYTLAKTEQLHGALPRARVCWLATESDALPPPQEMNGAKPPQVLIVGRLEEMLKGHRELIACWPKVAAAVPDAQLRIVGTGSGSKALRALACQSPVANHIIFEGFVPDTVLDSLYSRATVFAMPSRGEGFGLVYVEAMRNGLPVIASIHDAAPEIVLEGQTGYTVNLDQRDELPERIIYLLKNPDKAKQLGVNGQRRWAEHFCYSAFRRRWQPILREFLSFN